MKWERYMRAVGTIIMVAVGVFALGCGGAGGGRPSSAPLISNINSSTNPSSPVGLAIEVNGSGFQGAPGQVVFTQGSIVATVTPNAAGWSDSSIVVVVPSGSGTNSFAVPGTVSVTVVTSGGTSNAVNLALVQNVTFNVNNVTWTTALTPPLPKALTGLRAVPVPATSTSAFVVVAGGFDGTANVSTVLSNTLAPDGSVGTSWTAISTNPLPAPRAHFGMVVAHPGNSLVPVGSAFVYAIGGQQNSSDTPGGTNTVFMASVNVNTGAGVNLNPGAVGTWTSLSSTLPASLVGPAVTLYNGHIYVVGGLTTTGTPSANVYSAAVNSDGTLSSWSTSTNAYPVGVSFATAFGFGGNLYVLNGDPNSSTNPNEQGLPAGIQDVRLASAHNGVVGTWTLTNITVKKRKKHNTWLAFGQVIDAEGVYDGAPSLELERTVIQSDGMLAAWNGITSSPNQINANVYNAAAFVSPLQSPSGNPRFLLLGGQAVSTAPPGPLSNKVFVNNAP